MIEVVACCAIALIFIPPLAYLVVKMGTAGYLRAISQFRSNHNEESRNGNGNEEA